MKRTHILCACAFAMLVAGVREVRSDLRISLSIGRINSADELSRSRRYDSYADRYNRYSAFGYSSPRYLYGPTYYQSRYYGSSYFRYSPARYYYRPAYTLPYSSYGLNRSSVYQPHQSYGSGWGIDLRIGTSRRPRSVAPPSDCCYRPYYCYGMGMVPSQPPQRMPVSPPATYQPSPAPVLGPAPTPAVPALPPVVKPPTPPAEPLPVLPMPKLSVPTKVTAATAIAPQ
ncbi:MAG: hypothetical protein O3A00_15525 [Planctomycetota bacterium]|nr:hypothetical protein [Planctomycetota bacterium]